MRILGQHEGNLNNLLHIGVQLYDTFLPFYQDALSAVLIQYAGTLREDTELYLKKATSVNGAGINKQNQKLDKVKRELFRKMTSQVIIFYFLYFILKDKVHYDLIYAGCWSAFGRFVQKTCCTS